jgi:hypothetical protein
MSIVVLKSPPAVAGMWSVSCNFEDCANVFDGGANTKADLLVITKAAGWHWMRELHMCPACLASQSDKDPAR